MEVELRKAAIGGALARQLHITDSFTLEAAPLTKPPALRGVSDFGSTGGEISEEEPVSDGQQSI